MTTGKPAAMKRLRVCRSPPTRARAAKSVVSATKATISAGGGFFSYLPRPPHGGRPAVVELLVLGAEAGGQGLSGGGGRRGGRLGGGLGGVGRTRQGGRGC